MGPGARLREQEKIRQWINRASLLQAAGMWSSRPPPCRLAGSPVPLRASSLSWASSSTHLGHLHPTVGAVGIQPWASSASHRGNHLHPAMGITRIPLRALFCPGCHPSPAMCAILILRWALSPSHRAAHPAAHPRCGSICSSSPVPGTGCHPQGRTGGGRRSAVPRRPRLLSAGFPAAVPAAEAAHGAGGVRPGAERGHRAGVCPAPEHLCRYLPPLLLLLLFIPERRRAPTPHPRSPPRRTTSPPSSTPNAPRTPCTGIS